MLYNYLAMATEFTWCKLDRLFCLKYLGLARKRPWEQCLHNTQVNTHTRRFPKPARPIKKAKSFHLIPFDRFTNTYITNFERKEMSKICRIILFIQLAEILQCSVSRVLVNYGEQMHHMNCYQQHCWMSIWVNALLANHLFLGDHFSLVNQNIRAFNTRSSVNQPILLISHYKFTCSTGSPDKYSFPVFLVFLHMNPRLTIISVFVLPVKTVFYHENREFRFPRHVLDIWKKRKCSSRYMKFSSCQRLKSFGSWSWTHSVHTKNRGGGKPIKEAASKIVRFGQVFDFPKNWKRQKKPGYNCPDVWWFFRAVFSPGDGFFQPPWFTLVSAMIMVCS